MADRASATAVSSPRFVPIGAAGTRRKCACGTHTTGGGECSACQKGRIQAKLKIGEVDDVLEREADRMADQVVAAGAHALPWRAHDSISGGGAAINTDGLWSGAGQALDAGTRDFMETR